MKASQRFDSNLPVQAAGYRWMRPSTLAFLVLSGFVVCVLIFGDRSHLLDQDNYVQYFRETNLQWFRDLWTDSSSLRIFCMKAVTEELGWRLWVLGVGALGVSPETGVRITVILLNVLVILALRKTRRPLQGLILWILIPTAFVTIGLFQIRQGFAFSIAMYFAQCRQRPVRGAILASIIHTTFAFPALFLILANVFGKQSKILAITAVVAASLVMSLLSDSLFNVFGGRRLDEYSQYVDLTPNFVIAVTLYMIVPALILTIRPANSGDAGRESVIQQLAITHVGLLVFLIVSFFVYPFATQRINYYGPLLLAFLIPEVRVRNLLVLWTLALISVTLGYDVIKNYLMGTYHYFL